MARVLPAIAGWVLLMLLATPMPAHPATLAGVARDAAARPVIGQGPDGATPAGGRTGAAGRNSISGARPAGGWRDDELARSDYLLHCSGCHGPHGHGNTIGRIPPLRDRIGNFLALPEGRAFLVQVPGVNNTGLDDAAIARVMNWLIPQFAGSSLVSTFEPYRADEVAGFRARRPVDVPGYRRTLARRLADNGRPVDY